MKKKRLIIGSGLVLLGLANSNNKDNSRYWFNNYIYSNTVLQKDYNNKQVIYFIDLNKKGYLVNHPIQYGSDVYIHTLHLLNYDNTLFGIYKATSNDSDFSSVKKWQKVVGYNAPYFIEGNLRYDAILYY